MYQIDNSTVASSIPPSTTAGIAGFFTDGDPVLNVPATVLPAEFMNMLMLELLNVLSAAGVTPSKTNFTQLTLAINQLTRGGGGAYGLDSGSANIYAVAFTPAVAVATDGMVLRFRAKTANTGACTFAPDGVAAAPVLGLGAQPLQGGEIVVGGTCTVIWLAVLGKWVLLSCTGGALQLASGSASGHALTLIQMQSAYGVYAADAGSANAYAVAYAPAVKALSDGMRLTFQAVSANTGAATLNVNGLGARALVGGAQQALQGGEVAAGSKVMVIYHATLDAWVLWGAAGGSPQVPTATKSLHALNLQQAQSLVASARGMIYVNSSSSVSPGSYLVDTSAGGFTLTLPASPNRGDTLTLIDAMGTWAAANFILARNGKTIMAKAEDLTVNVSDQQFSIWYNGSDWRLV